MPQNFLLYVPTENNTPEISDEYKIFTLIEYGEEPTSSTFTSSNLYYLPSKQQFMIAPLPLQRKTWDLRWIISKDERELRGHHRKRKSAERTVLFYLYFLDEVISAGSLENYLSQFIDQIDLYQHIRRLLLSYLKNTFDDHLPEDIEEELLLLPLLKEPLSPLSLELIGEKQKTIDSVIRSANRAIDPSKMKGLLRKIFLKLRRKNSGYNPDLIEGSKEEGAFETSSEEEEYIVCAMKSPLRLKNWKFRSNLSMRSGKILVTNKRIITFRRKFSFLPVLPFIALVRLNNRMVALGSQMINMLGRLRPILSSILRAIGPALLGFLALFWEKLPWDRLPKLSLLPPLFSFPAVNFAINFAIQNPHLLVTFGGLFGAFGSLFINILRALFLRAKAVIVIKPDMVLGLSTLDLHQRTKRKNPALLLRPLGVDITGQKAFGFFVAPTFSFSNKYRKASKIDLKFARILNLSLQQLSILQLGLYGIISHNAPVVPVEVVAESTSE